MNHAYTWYVCSYMCLRTWCRPEVQIEGSEVHTVTRVLIPLFRRHINTKILLVLLGVLRKEVCGKVYI